MSISIDVSNGWKAAIEGFELRAEIPARMKALRYLFYVVFAVAAFVFWVVFAVFVMGWIPGDRACTFEPSGCPEPPIWRTLFNLVVAYGAIPATVLVFVFYRRLVRRKLGMDEDA